MLRIEIIANHSVEENLLDAFAREEVGKYYTKYPGVFGVGNSGPRMGDAIWPEENFSLVIWCEEEEARGIARAVAAVKSQFPDEGVKVFGLPEQISRFPQSALYQSPGPVLAAAEVPVPAGEGARAGPRPPEPGVPGPAAPAAPAPSSSPPPVYGTFPDPAGTPGGASSGIIREYDGQNMDEGR